MEVPTENLTNIESIIHEVPAWPHWRVPGPFWPSRTSLPPADLTADCITQNCS